MKRIFGIVSHATHLPIRGKNRNPTLLQAGKNGQLKAFPLALGRSISQVCGPPLQLMRLRLLFCAVLAVLCAQLHAQSTGIFVNSNNNVGIGTTSPGRGKLTVVDANKPPGSTVANLYIQSNDAIAADKGGSLLFGAVGDNSGNDFPTAYISGKRENGLNLNEAAYLQFGVSDGSDAINERMRITSAGNVGIGTTSPSYLLDVNGIIHSTVGSGSNISLSKTLGASIAFDNNAGVQTALIESGSPASGSNRLEFWTNTANNTGIVERMRIDNAGNVGIGTTNPGYKLDVAGQVHASSFVASSGNNYADFVFKPGYKLEPLSDVETAIKKDGHLPGIPSEAEAKAHGIDLASMQVKLLQKIEELTLHQIDEEKHQVEQDKRIEQLEKENAELRKKVIK
jgi:hypothetical protein